MNKSITVQFLLLFFIVILTPLSLTRAQLFNDVTLQITPSSPKAFEGVEINILSFSVDLGRAEIFWYINDGLVKSGVGEQNLIFTTGTLGSLSKVDVVVIPTAGGKISGSATIRPAEVDLLWEAHSYTPPFYKGGAHATSESLIKITAIPHLFINTGSPIDQSQLIYSWEQDGNILGRSSGFGKNNIVVSAHTVQRGKTRVTVTVSSFNETLRAQSSIAIRSEEPKILFYEKHPLDGVRYGQALQDDFLINNEEITIHSEPYFFSLDDVFNNNILYEWFVNGRATSIIGTDEKDLTLFSEQSEIREVGLLISNTVRVLQVANSTFLVNFSNKSPFGI